MRRGRGSVGAGERTIVDGGSLYEWVARSRGERRLIVLSAVWMYAGAALVGLIEGFVPGTPRFPMTSGVVALVITFLLLLFGGRVGRRPLVLLGPVGVVLIAYALGQTRGYGDGAALYAWPVLWTAHFFDRKATIMVMAVIGVAHAWALHAMPAGVGYPSRWIDVMVSMTVVAMVVRSLTESKDRLLARVSAEARRDLLTGLLNRRGFDERASVEIERCHRERLSLGVIIFDIDHFKRINDQHGHDVGDQVLARVGDLLSEEIRGIDIAARIGGEEFAVVLPRATEEGARAIAERVRSAISTDSIAGVYRVTMSAGIAAAVAPAEVGPLLQAADQALYSAKRGGRDRTMTAADAECAVPPPTSACRRLSARDGDPRREADNELAHADARFADLDGAFHSPDPSAS